MEEEPERVDPLSNSDSELGAIFGAASKRYGSIFLRGTEKYQPNRIPTGIFMLDFALLGGIPEGRITQLVGEKHAGKSTVAAKIISGAQMMYPDQEIVFLDIEQTFDPVWNAKLGVDLSRVSILEVDTGEKAVDMADAVLRAKETSILVVDSLAAMIPFKEAQASAEDNHVGLQSRLIGELCRKVTATIATERLRGHVPTVLFINQFRTKIGVQFGDPRTNPGGRAVEHFPSLNIRLLNKEHMGKDEHDVDIVDYNEHEFHITKWKVSNGPRSGAFRLIRNDLPLEGLREGDIDNASTMIVFAKKFGLWGGAGQNQSLQFRDYDLRFRNQEEAKTLLNSDPDVYYALYYELIKQQAISRSMPDDFIARFD